MIFKRVAAAVLSGVIAAQFTCPCFAEMESANSDAEFELINNEKLMDEDKNALPEAENKNLSEAEEEEEEIDNDADNTNEQQVENRVDEDITPINDVKVLSKDELVKNFLSEHENYFPELKIKHINAKLQKLSEEDLRELNFLSLHNPKRMTILSVGLGLLGVDRMVIGKTGTGVLKLFSFFFGIVPGIIWWIVDIFKIEELTQQCNFEKLMQELSYIQ